MENVAFQFGYDGPALVNHEIDVRDIAPALLAIGEMLNEANQVLNKGAVNLTVKVKGRFKSGSFNVDFSVASSLVENAQIALTSGSVTAVSNLISLLGFHGITGKSLLEFIKWTKNRSIKKVVKTSDGSAVVLMMDNDKFELPPKVLELYQNVTIRKSIEICVSQPLKKEGIDTFSTKGSSKSKALIVKKRESDYYEAPEVPEKVIGEQTIMKTLQVVSITFVDDKKWRFTDGTVTFPARVEDEDFLRSVNSNQEYFSKDDYLTVNLSMKQVSSISGLKTEYVIKNVLKHEHAAKQIDLPMD